MDILANFQLKPVYFVDIKWRVVSVKDKLDELKILFKHVEIWFKYFGEFCLLQKIDELGVGFEEGKEDFPVDFEDGALIDESELFRLDEV